MSDFPNHECCPFCTGSTHMAYLWVRGKSGDEDEEYCTRFLGVGPIRFLSLFYLAPFEWGTVHHLTSPDTYRDKKYAGDMLRMAVVYDD